MVVSHVSGLKQEEGEKRCDEKSTVIDISGPSNDNNNMDTITSLETSWVGYGYIYFYL